MFQIVTFCRDYDDAWFGGQQEGMKRNETRRKKHLPFETIRVVPLMRSVKYVISSLKDGGVRDVSERVPY